MSNWLKRALFGGGLYALGSLVFVVFVPSQTTLPAEAKPQQGAVIVNRLVGETIVVKQSEGPDNDWTSVIEVRLEPNGTVPFMHVHDGYDEVFEVLSGKIAFELSSGRQVLRAGEQLTIGRGQAHVPSNPFAEPASFRVTVSSIPSFTSCIAQTHRRLGDASSSWVIRHIRVGRLALACDMYLSTIPVWVQAVGMTLSAPILEALGFPVYEPMVNVPMNESNSE